MTTEELLYFLKQNVNGFTDSRIVRNDFCYHYTSHWDSINNIGFLGAPIDENLDKTQNETYSPPAESNPGVVFAYENINDARDEGFGCDIIKIKYKSAISATHTQEEQLSNLTNDSLKKIGIEPDVSPHPKTILILNNEIIGFNKVD